MMRIGDRFTVNTYAYTQSLTAEETVRRLADLGVRAFELMFYPGHLWLEDGPAALAGLRRALDRAGATLVSVNTPNIDLNLAAASAEMRAHSFAVNEAYLRIAGALGAGGLVLGPGKANPLFPLPRETMLGHFHAALDRLLPVAEAEGVAIWAENQPFAFLPDAAGLAEAVAGHGRSASATTWRTRTSSARTRWTGWRLRETGWRSSTSRTPRGRPTGTIRSATATSTSPGWPGRSAARRPACRRRWRSSAPSRTGTSRARRRR